MAKNKRNRKPKLLPVTMKYTQAELMKSPNKEIVYGVEGYPERMTFWCDPKQVGFEPGKGPAKKEKPSE